MSENINATTSSKAKPEAKLGEIHGRLSPPGRDGGNAFQVFSRYLDYDARLQSWLITVSTVFGIGISLMVEGVILLLLRIARYFRSEADSGTVDDDPRDIDGS